MPERLSCGARYRRPYASCANARPAGRHLRNIRQTVITIGCMKHLAVAMIALLPALAAGPEVDKGKSFGGPAAPLTVEVYSAFTCPHCRAFHDMIVPQLMRDFILSGKIYLVNRDFPLNGPDHRYGREAHAYANAAARIGKYEAVAGRLWTNQAAWSASGKIWDTIAPALSTEEQKKVQALVKDPGVTGEVERELNAG